MLGQLSLLLLIFFQNAVNEQEGENKRSEKLQSSVYPIREDVIVSKYDSEDTDSSVTKLTQKLSLYNTNKQAVDSENISNTTNTSIVASRISHQAETLKDKPTQNTTDIKDLTGSKLTDTEEQSKHSSQVTLKTATTGEQKTEEECITIIQYKTKHRHANQLFVRGDNVVSVVLLD
jgi:small nuclear ribonucleoprotein (snRNP)-like protein